jgi:hypothetical protein
MVRERFREYGYTQGDMAFTAPEDAEAALKYRIPVYILYPNNTAELVKNRKSIDDAMYDGRMLGMGDRDKQLLGFFKADYINEADFSLDQELEDGIEQ